MLEKTWWKSWQSSTFRNYSGQKQGVSRKAAPAPCLLAFDAGRRKLAKNSNKIIKRTSSFLCVPAKEANCRF